MSLFGCKYLILGWWKSSFLKVLFHVGPSRHYSPPKVTMSGGGVRFRPKKKKKKIFHHSSLGCFLFFFKKKKIMKSIHFFFYDTISPLLYFILSTFPQLCFPKSYAYSNTYFLRKLQGMGRSTLRIPIFDSTYGIFSSIPTVDLLVLQPGLAEPYNRFFPVSSCFPFNIIIELPPPKVAEGIE